jgi:hypothetical protein
VPKVAHYRGPSGPGARGSAAAASPRGATERPRALGLQLARAYTCTQLRMLTRSMLLKATQSQPPRPGTAGPVTGTLRHGELRREPEVVRISVLFVNGPAAAAIALMAINLNPPPKNV